MGQNWSRNGGRGDKRNGGYGSDSGGTDREYDSRSVPRRSPAADTWRGRQDGGGRPVPAPRSPDPADVESATGVVKFFNHAKGFGFVGLSDGRDVFVHVSKVEAAGVELDEGTRIECRVGTSQRNGKLEVVDIQSATPGEPPQRAFSPRREDGASRSSDDRPPRDRPSGPPRPTGPKTTSDGVVEHVNHGKSIFFVRVPNVEKNVFVHMSLAERAGMADVQEGDIVSIDWFMGDVGPRATAIRPV